jgi:predicted dehydrogenase
MTNPIRTGVIGCGGIAQIMHLPHLIETPQFELVALADNDAAVLDAVADRYGVSARFTSPAAMLTGSDLDAVIVCHSGSHRDSVLSALEAGVHVLVEKPLAWNMREAGEIAEAAANSDRVVQVGYHKLYDPGFAYAKAQLQQIDDLAFAECTVLHAADEFNRAPYAILKADGLSQFNYDLPDWPTMQRGLVQGLTSGEAGRLTREAVGEERDPAVQVAFTLLTISLIHHIYTLYGFLGDPVRVLHTRIWRGGASLHVLIEFPGDVHCALNWHLLPYLNDYRETYAFYGNRRRVRLEMPGPYYRNFPSPVVIQGGEGELSWEKRVTVSFREAFHNELLAFADSISNGTPPISSVASAVKHTRFIEAIIAAAR